jgi:hypothetical protein
MNRRSQGSAVSKTLVGFLQYKVAEGLSPNTLTNYERHLVVLSEYLENKRVDKITTQDLRASWPGCGPIISRSGLQGMMNRCPPKPAGISGPHSVRFSPGSARSSTSPTRWIR